ncbi:MAG: glutamate synthase-related protein [Anaerolineales bacterium]
MSTYHRYHIDTHPAPHEAPHPNRFIVRVGKVGLAKLLLREIIHQRGNMAVVTSRPCMYGVFSGPIGGFAPRPEHCVGCLRCTMEHPEFVRVEPNPARLELGDSYLSPDQVDTLLYEAATGRVPVKGAGYRGSFGGRGWDSMWTDMSEIVRPTRDGIHGREFISTAVDIGWKPRWLTVEPDGTLSGPRSKVIHLPIPMIFDLPPRSVRSKAYFMALTESAHRMETLAVVPFEWAQRLSIRSREVAPLVEPDQVPQLQGDYQLIELDGWNREAYEALRHRFPEAVIALRHTLGEDLQAPLDAGISTFHLAANYHGQTHDGFILGAVRQIHEGLIRQGIRQHVTLIGSGGIVAAEHVPKAIIAGLDAVALDIAPVVALQGRMVGECTHPYSAQIKMPDFNHDWACQRLQNLFASWRDQLLEIMGAMGLREVRRLRGEIGRAMFQAELEHMAFRDIEGFGGAP